jgi:Protein of unknown function (DUF2786)
MNQPKVEERILNKIKKCLALSTSSEPHEAASALRQAQKLMELHGVSVEAIKMSDISEQQIKSRVSVSKPKTWENNLLKVVGEAFGCDLYWDRSHSYVGGKDVFGSYVYVGIKQQVELAAYTAEVMQRKLMKAKAVYVASLSSYHTRQEKVQKADGFCLGWVASVSDTIYVFANTQETTLLIEEYINSICKGATAKHRGGSYSRAAFEHGMEVGSSESIHRPMGTNAGQLRIGA